MAVGVHKGPTLSMARDLRTAVGHPGPLQSRVEGRTDLWHCKGIPTQSHPMHGGPAILPDVRQERVNRGKQDRILQSRPAT